MCMGMSGCLAVHFRFGVKMAGSVVVDVFALSFCCSGRFQRQFLFHENSTGILCSSVLNLRSISIIKRLSVSLFYDILHL